MHTIILLEKHTLCKLTAKLPYCRNYSIRKDSRKKRKETVTIKFLITIADLQFKQIAIQEDHNILTYSLFFQLFQLSKIRENPCCCQLYIETRSFCFSFLTKEPKSFKKRKIHTLFFNMTRSINMKHNTIFMYDTYTYHM